MQVRQARKIRDWDAWPQTCLWKLVIMHGVSLCNHQRTTRTRTTMWSGRATPCWCASLPSWVTAWGAEGESVTSYASLPRRYDHSCPRMRLCNTCSCNGGSVSQSRSELCTFYELWEISERCPILRGNKTAQLKQTSTEFMMSAQDVKPPFRGNELKSPADCWSLSHTGPGLLLDLKHETQRQWIWITLVEFFCLYNSDPENCHKLKKGIKPAFLGLEDKA